MKNMYRALLCFLLSFSLINAVSADRRNQNYFDDQKYWTPQWVNVKHLYDGDLPYGAEIEFRFDSDLKLFKEWTVSGDGVNSCGEQPYPFVLEVTLLVHDVTQDSIDFGNSQGSDWSFLGSSGAVPAAYRDTAEDDFGMDIACA